MFRSNPSRGDALRATRVLAGPCSLAWLAGLLALAAGCTAVPEVEPARFENDIRDFEAADRRSPPKVGGTLFVGSSSIRLWNLAASFPGSDALNRGFGGSHISDCVVLLPRIVLPYRPQRIVFYAGDNDIAHGKSAERVRADWQRFAQAVHAELPSARLIFLAIKPSPARWTLWPEARRANGLIQAYCATDTRLQFVDVASPMLGADGLPRPELYVADRLHLSEAGYKLWSDLLTATLGFGLLPRPREILAMRNYGLLAAAFSIVAFPVLADDTTKAELKIEVGKPAPDFTLKDQDGKDVKLSTYRNQHNVLMAFYPKDFTGGRTAELKGFRDEHEEFVRAEVKILGVSTDGVESHQKFCDSLKLPFSLLADTGAKVSSLYGVAIRPPAGEVLSGRSVFLIDKQGSVRYADAKYELKTAEDHDALLKAVRALGAGKTTEKKTSSAPFRQPQVGALAFGRITVDGKEHENDVIFDHGKVRERDKGPSRDLKAKYGHTPLTVKEEIPWSCKRLLIGTGMDGQLPVLDEIKTEAKKRGVELILLKTEEAVKYLEKHGGEDLNVILHITC